MAAILSVVEAIRNTTIIVDRTANLALQIWQCLKDFQCEEMLQRSENSSPEIRSIQVELSNIILTLQNLSEAIHSTPNNDNSS